MHEILKVYNYVSDAWALIDWMPVAARHAPPMRVGAPQDATLRMPSDYPLVEYL